MSLTRESVAAMLSALREAIRLVKQKVASWQDQQVCAGLTNVGWRLEQALLWGAASAHMSREEVRGTIEEIVPRYTGNDVQKVCRFVEDLLTGEARARTAEANNAQLARHRNTLDLDAKAQALVRSLRETLQRQDAELAKLKTEVARAYRNNATRNRDLDALHFVWCDGGCETGVHRYDGAGPDAVTEEVVAAAERNTERLRSWFVTYRSR